MPAALEKDDIGNILDQLLDKFRVRIRHGLGGRFRVKLGAAPTDRRFLLFIGAVKGLCPIAAVRLPGTFIGVAALPGLAGEGEDPVANLLDRRRGRGRYFFAERLGAKIASMTVVLNRIGTAELSANPSADINISS